MRAPEHVAVDSAAVRYLATMEDTSAAAEWAAQRATLRLPPAERMRRALAHSEMMRDLALARLRARHPGVPTVTLVERLLGERLLPPRS